MADKAENENTGGPAGSERRAARRSDVPGGGSTRLRESGFPMRKASTLPDVSAYSGPVSSGTPQAGSDGPHHDPAVPNTATADPSTPATQQIAATPVAGERGVGKQTGGTEAGAPDYGSAHSQAKDNDGAPSEVPHAADAAGNDATDDDAPHISGADAYTARDSGTDAYAARDSSATDTDTAGDAGDHTSRLQTTAVPVPEARSGFGSTAMRARSGSAGTRSADDDAAPDTSALTIRPPEEDVTRRASQRDEAAAAKPILPRVMQVVVAVFFPVILLGAAVRAVTTPLFLWAEYHRPGFPADSYGFSTEDRMTYGSYAMDYILNWAPARYLGDLVNTDGDQLFLDSEVGHMADVKAVLSTGFVVATVLAILAIAACVYLARRYPGGVRRALFAGAVATLVLAVTLAVVGVLAWETFFTQVHALFFADGTWTFRLDDTLIRLFPAQFWIDAAAVVGAIVLLGSVLTLVLTWPTRARRERSANAYARRRAVSGV